MCWNKDISLNTFIFGIGTLLFVYYSNNNTRYKLDGFSSKWNYIFYLSFIFIQLIEYFIWKSIETNNNDMNRLFSLIGFIVIFLQPITSLMTIQNKNIYPLIKVYVIIIIIYLILRKLFNPIKFITTVGKNGHLSWKWLENKNYWQLIFIVWIMLFSYKDLRVSYKSPQYILYYLIALYLYFTDYNENTAGSSWCWISNTLFIYILFMLLFVLPYKEKGLC